MTNIKSAAEKPRSSGIGGALGVFFGVYLGWGVGAGLGVAIAMIGSGAEVLGMPPWAWSCPLICAAAMARFYSLALRKGQAGELRTFLRVGVVSLGMLATLCLLLGVKEQAAFQVDGGRAGFNLSEAMQTLRHILAWGVLVVVPAIACLGSGLVVLNLDLAAGEKSTQQGGWRPTEEWKAKPEVHLKSDESFEQRFAQQRAARASDPNGQSTT